MNAKKINKKGNLKSTKTTGSDLQCKLKLNKNKKKLKPNQTNKIDCEKDIN
jgi:hypothetical protein